MTTDYDALVERLGTSPNYLGQTGRDAAQAIADLRAELAASDAVFKETAMELLKAKARAHAVEKTVATLSCGDGAALAEEIARADAAQKEVTDLTLRNAELALKLLAAEKGLDARQTEHERLQTMRLVHNAAISEAAGVADTWSNPNEIAAAIRERKR